MRSVVLPVAYHHQRTPDTCLAACVKMVVEYYGGKVDELGFYNKARLSPKYEGLCDVCIVPELKKAGFRVVSYWDGKLEDWGVWTPDLAAAYVKAEKRARAKANYVHRRHATLQTIKDFVKKGIPIICEVLAGNFYRTKEVGTHMIVVTGYTPKGLYICDPWSRSRLISKEHFLRAWSPDGKFRSMIVITPVKK